MKLEDFALADDRSEALKHLIPGTSDYYYYHCLNAQHIGDFEQVSQMLELWIQRHGYTPEVGEILNRQALLEYERNPGKSLDHIKKELDLRFDHQKETAGRKTDYPTTLDQELISIPILTQQALVRHKNLQGIEDAGLDTLRHDHLGPEQRRDLLQRLRCPDVPDLAELVVDDLKYKHSEGFGSHPIHGLLLKSQLDECLRLMPELMDNSDFVKTYLSKLLPSEDADLRYDLLGRQAYFDRLWDFAKKLAPAFNSMKANILYQMLDLKRTHGNYDHDLFVTYIKFPRNVDYINPDYAKCLELGHVKADLNADFSDITGIPPIETDEDLVRDYLSHYFVKAKDYSAYVKYIKDTCLKEIFAETKIVNGVGDMEQWYSMMAPSQYQAVKDRVDLDFAHTNREFFTTDEPVSLDLYVKNIKSLIVKIFELNTFNYYQANLQEVDTTINLDGLAATWEEVINYDEPALRCIRRTFSFPQIDRPGIFVVEFIGNGKSSRAVIRKGRLYFVDKVGPAGHELVILDEKNQRRPEATIWLARREFKPDKGGVITIPFSSVSKSWTIILKDKDFCSLASLEHLSENYDLSAGFYVDCESLLKQSDAKVIVRPVLSLNGHPISLSLLEDIQLIIESVDRDGVSSVKEIPDFEVFEDRESIFEFQVPDNLANIHFTLTAKIQNISLNKKTELTDSAEFALNGIEGTMAVEDIFLSHIDNAYILELLGKNGESKPDHPIELEIKHCYFSDTVHLSMQTDTEGLIRLGRLDGIEWIKATGGTKDQRTWCLAKDFCHYPASIHERVGKVIRLPYVGTVKDKVRLCCALLEKRFHRYIADFTHVIRLREGFIEISGLPAGDYELFLKESGTKINLRLTGGKTRDGFIISENRILESKNEYPLYISGIDIDKSFVKVRLGKASEFARMHVFATHFMPSYDVFSSLAYTGLPEPYQLQPSRPQSQYVAGRNIGDEYRYILERKYAEKFPGNMLDRPELLLNPWRISKTKTAEDKLEAAEELPGHASPMVSTKERPSGAPRPDEIKSIFNGNLDFLAQTSAVLLNLKPDENGVVTIDRNDLGEHPQIRLVAIDPFNTVCREICVGAGDERQNEFALRLETRDLRLAQSLNSEQHFTEQKQISIINPDQIFRLDDMTNSDFEIYDSLDKVYQFLATFHKNETFREFGFILRWPEMDDAEKQEKYSKYACHELSFFIHHKDRKFFDKVILPYLQNKKDKTFLDHLMLGDDLSSYLEPWAYSQLNIVEKILLGRQRPGDKDQIARYVKDRFDMISPDIGLYNYLFDTALKLEALESGKSMKTELRKSYCRLIDPPQVGRGQERPFFRKMDKTREWVENNYYKLPIKEQRASLIRVNAFWNDYARSDPQKPFLSKYFVYAHRNFAEMMLALSVLDLPFKAGKHEPTAHNVTFSLKAKSPMIVFHKEIKEGKSPEEGISILASQRFFSTDDIYFYVNNERRDKFIKDEFLVHTAYGCQVLLSNLTSSRQKLRVLLQIPRGAMPLNNGFYTKGVPAALKPYETWRLEYYFYFPETGRFTHYPLQVSRNEEHVTAVPALEFNVVAESSLIDTESWQYVSQNSTQKEVLDFLRSHNLNRLDLNKIAFRMKDKAFFQKMVRLLRERHNYHHTLWSYSVYHNEKEHMREYLRHSAYRDRCGSYIDTTLLTIDPVEQKTYQHIEYKPLVNARTHQLDNHRRILNDRFYEQYHRFMKYLSYRPVPDDEDLMSCVYYLLLQDRVSEAVRFFKRIHSEDIESRIQYDYLQAYIDFYMEDIDQARQIAEKYSDYPVPRWRNMFRHIADQLDELEGKAPDIIDKESRGQIQSRLAATEPGFDFKVESRQVTINYQNLSSCRVNYYPMDIELLFSRSPFVRQQTEHFAFIRPNKTEEIELPVGETGFTFDLPEEFRNSNLMVEITAGGIKKSQTYYANSLDIQIIENYGYLRAVCQDTGKLLSRVYVKVYARMKGSNEVYFYKDGYTDLRGRFDYASLNTSELDDVEKFAILILSEDYGAVIREAIPPKQ